MKIICINGQGGAGKDTFVDFCATNRARVRNFSMVDCIKRIASVAGWEGAKELKDRKFLSDLKDLIADYNDLPFVDVLAEIEMAKHNHRWWESETDLKKELICFVHSRETKDIQRWREQYGAKALLIRRTSIEKEYGNHADDQVFELEYDYVIFNDKDLSSLEREAQTFMELIEKEKWESHI